ATRLARGLRAGLRDGLGGLGARLRHGVRRAAGEPLRGPGELLAGRARLRADGGEGLLGGVPRVVDQLVDPRVELARVGLEPRDGLLDLRTRADAGPGLLALLGEADVGPLGLLLELGGGLAQLLAVQV